jgi:glycerol uptake facilitator-like aquaporin
MPRVGIEKRLVGEFIGSAGLLLIVVGSGIMAEKLAGGNMALALLANAVATGAGLFALIQTFGEISGSHFNPAVSFVEFLWKRLTFRECLGYIIPNLRKYFGGTFGPWDLWSRTIPTRIHGQGSDALHHI